MGNLFSRSSCRTHNNCRQMVSFFGSGDPDESFSVFLLSTWFCFALLYELSSFLQLESLEHNSLVTVTIAMIIMISKFVIFNIINIILLLCSQWPFIITLIFIIIFWKPSRTSLEYLFVLIYFISTFNIFSDFCIRFLNIIIFLFKSCPAGGWMKGSSLS